MPATIHAYDAHCALGRGTDACVDALLAGGQPPGVRHYDFLREPLSLPYFAMPPAAGDIYQTLNRVATGVLNKAGLSPSARQRTAVLLGSSSFDVQVSEDLYREDLTRRGAAAVPMPIIGYGKLADRLATELELGDYRYTYSTACTSSANALLYGQRLITAGLADHALVIGLEWGNHTSVLGFAGLGLISPSGAMHPFDSDRDGLLLGEAIGCVLLSGMDAAPAGLPHLAGGAIGTDNHSLTAANIDGVELSRVITSALQDSGIEASALKGIKAHATASLKNDEAEAAAVKGVLGDKLPTVFALKPFCGHTLGASGALELALTLGCLARGQLPGNPGVRNDGGLGINLLRETTIAPEGYYLFNCFAFGGNNNAFVIYHPAAEARA
ncbi:MAG TPA: beta-ketoacyl synthase N-terminal-like domain-containing protein [Cellvibrionaceae bacterium]